MGGPVLQLWAAASFSSRYTAAHNKLRRTLYAHKRGCWGALYRRPKAGIVYSLQEHTIPRF